MESYKGSASSDEQPPQENRMPQNQRDQLPIRRRNEPLIGVHRNILLDDDFNREAFDFYVIDVHSNISLRDVLHNSLYTKFNRIIHLLNEINHGNELWTAAIQFTHNNVNSPNFERRSLKRNEEQRRRYNLEMVHIQHEMYVILQKLDVVYRKIFVSSRMIHCRRFDAETEKRLESDYVRNKLFVFKNGNILQLVEPFFEVIRNNAITDNREQELPEPPRVESDFAQIGRNRNETGRDTSANSKEVEKDSDQMRDIREICGIYRTQVPPPSAAINVPTIRIQEATPSRRTDEMDQREAKESNEEELLNKIRLTSQESLKSLSILTGEPPQLESFPRSSSVDVEAVLAQAEEDKDHFQDFIEELERSTTPIPGTKIGSLLEEDEIFQMDDILTESTPGPQPEPKLEEAAQTVQPKGDLIKQRLAQFESQCKDGPKFVQRKSVDGVQESAKPPTDPSKKPTHTSPEEDIKKAPEDAIKTEGNNLVIDETEQATGGKPRIETRSTEGLQKGNKPPGKESEESNVGVTTNIEPVPVVENKNQETETDATISPREILPPPECPVGKQLLVREAEEALGQQDADATDVPPKARPVSTRNRSGNAEVTTSDDRKKDKSSEILPDPKKGGIPEAITDRREKSLDINKKKDEEGIRKAVKSKEEDKVVAKEGNVEEAAVKADIITIVAVEK